MQRQLEHGLNCDLSRVRVHTDSEADTLAKGVNAVAFTSGQDIYFRSGTFDPNTRSGLELLAHEVTHTVQQAQGKVRPGIDADAGLEQEARATGAKLAATRAFPGRSRSALPHTSPTGSSAAGPALQRSTPAGAAVQGPPAASDQTFEYVRTTTSGRLSSTRSSALHGANSP